MPDKKVDEELFGQKQGHWVTAGGRKLFIPEGKDFDQAYNEAFGDSKNKASYMTASQESPVKDPSNHVPHFVLTADEINTIQTNARVGERVKYNHGTREGILVKLDRSVALILTPENKYDTVLTKDVNRAEDYTVYGLWKDIPDDFKNWMLKKSHIMDTGYYVNKKWEHFPRELKEILRDESAFETTRRNLQSDDPSNTDDFEGAKNKHADAINTNNPSRGVNGKLVNPQDNKRRDGRQIVDNEEQNNTFSAGEEHPESTYSNITGGSNSKEDYGDNLEDWRAAKPKPSKDVKQDIDSKKKVDAGETAVAGETNPLYNNPKKIKTGIPSGDGIISGAKYLSNEEAKKWLAKRNKEKHGDSS